MFYTINIYLFFKSHINWFSSDTIRYNVAICLNFYPFSTPSPVSFCRYHLLNISNSIPQTINQLNGFHIILCSCSVQFICCRFYIIFKYCWTSFSRADDCMEHVQICQESRISQTHFPPLNWNIFMCTKFRLDNYTYSCVCQLVIEFQKQIQY